MSVRANDLAERLRVFNDEVIAFINRCTEEEWRKHCAAEDWTVGVVARHIGANHYYAAGLAKLIVDGEPLPDLTMEGIIEAANQHAVDHADCTKDEVIAILKEEGAKLCEFVGGLDDAQLDRSGLFPLTRREVTAQQLVESVILVSGSEHFSHMKDATRG